jgi:hypothetical protein
MGRVGVLRYYIHPLTAGGFLFSVNLTLVYRGSIVKDFTKIEDF